MPYLLPAEYETFGLPPDTSDAWITAASAMMEAHCRRPTLNSASYTERMRIPREAQTVRLSYGPLISVDAVQARYARPNRHEELYGDAALQAIFTTAFALPGQWVTVDPATLELSLPTAEFRFACNLMGLRYAETDVTYTAGIATIPNSLKVACAQVVRNAQATPGFNVKSSKLDTLQTQYFSGTVIDPQIAAMLRPYIAERLG